MSTKDVALAPQVLMSHQFIPSPLREIAKAVSLLELSCQLNPTGVYEPCVLVAEAVTVACCGSAVATRFDGAGMTENSVRDSSRAMSKPLCTWFCIISTSQL